MYSKTPARGQVTAGEQHGLAVGILATACSLLICEV